MLCKETVCHRTPYIYSVQGASTDPCANNYCGPAPVSELETMAYENAISDVASRMFTLVTLAGKGTMWMFPWSNTLDFTDNTTCEMPVDFDNLVCTKNRFLHHGFNSIIQCLLIFVM